MIRRVIYVWMDALTNYLSVLDYPNQEAAIKSFGRQRCMSSARILPVFTRFTGRPF